MALFAFVALKERLPKVAVAGLAIGFAGTALLIRPTGSDRVDLLGALTVVGASISWAIGTLYAGRAPLPKRALLTAAMQLLCGGAVLGIVAIAGGELGRIHPEHFSRSSILALAYLIVFGTVVAFSAYSYLVKEAPPAIVSTYAYVNPVIAVLLGRAFLGEHVGPTTIVAGAIIVVAVAMIVTGRLPRKTAEPVTASAELPSPPAETARSRRR
jgi:drug/metabolite transporter (DMT)-like permease